MLLDKTRAEQLEMTEALDDRGTSEPCVLQRSNHALRHSDAPVLADGAQALFHVPAAQQLSHGGAREDALVIRDDVPWWPQGSECSLESIAAPTSVRSFEGNNRDHFAREVVDC